MLIAAALAKGTSQVHHVLDSADLERTRDILQNIGAKLEALGNGSWKVTGMENAPRGGLPLSPADCFVGESGTTCRLLTAILASGHGSFRIHGAGRMHERPIGTLTEALSALGADIRFEGRHGCPPLLIHARGLRGGSVSLSMDESSQYLSGLLLAAPFCAEALCVTLAGRKPVSWPYVGLTLQTLEDFGIAFTVETLESGTWQTVSWKKLTSMKPGQLRITVQPGTYQAGEHEYLYRTDAKGRIARVWVELLRPKTHKGILLQSF